MPTLRRRSQQPTPVSPQVQVPPNFPAIPQSIIDRFPEAEDWQKKLDDFWTSTTQALQDAQSQVASFTNSRVVFSVDSFLIYAKNGIAQPMFALDATGVKLGDVLVVSTAGRKVYIGVGSYNNAQTPFYVDNAGFFSLGDKLTWDPDTDTLSITGTIVVVGGTIGGFDIGADYIRDTANSMGLASTVTAGDDVRFWAGSTFAGRATAPFRVLESGTIVATAAAITGTISGRSTATIASTIDVAGIVVTDLVNARLNTSAKTMLSDFTFGATDFAGALKSGTITWNTATGAITGGSGVLVYRGGIVGAASGVATFTLDATTGNATFAGTITATSGTIGGFSIGADYIRDSGNSFGLASSVTGGDDVRFWAGATFANRGIAPFRVYESGVINVVSGTVGVFTLDSLGIVAGTAPEVLFLGQITYYGMYIGDLATGNDSAIFNHNGAFLRNSTAVVVSTLDKNGQVGRLLLKNADASTTVDLQATLGLVFTADTNLYRSAANTLKTDDALLVSISLAVGGALTAGSIFTAVSNGPGLGAGQNIAPIWQSGGAGFVSLGVYRTDDTNGGWLIGTSSTVVGDFDIRQNQGAGTPASRFYISTTGVVTVPNLAGVGSRTVKADANGVLSAP